MQETVIVGNVDPQQPQVVLALFTHANCITSYLRPADLNTIDRS